MQTAGSGTGSDNAGKSDTAENSKEAAENSESNENKEANGEANDADRAAEAEDSAKETFTITAANGMTLTIPAKYRDLLIIDTPDRDSEGVLISLFEKKSVEAAKEQELGYDGAGWLCSINRISEEKLHQLQCHDMYSNELFAKDDEGGYYIFCTPSDVRLIRDEYPEKELIAWGELCKWAAAQKGVFLKENAGLTADSCSNMLVANYLARTAYMDGVKYTLSTTEHGPLEPGSVDAEPYARKLLENCSYELTDMSWTPDGEYVALHFPEDDLRFDFFLAEGGENYIREVGEDGPDALYKVSFDDPSLKASAIMKEWYDQLAASQDAAASGETTASGDVTLQYSPDDLVGAWAEKIAGRGYIEISKNADKTYNVQINWGSSASEMYVWNMTAEADGSNGMKYENGRCAVLTFDEEGGETEEVRYENGTGRFYLNSVNEIMWEDETGHAGDDCVFISVD